MSDVKAKMLRGTIKLLARSGVQATSFGEVIRETHVPRGSIYHHFPGGKDQMVAEALDSVSGLFSESLDRFAGASPETIAREYFRFWRSKFDRRYPKSGCPVLAVVVTSESTDLLDHAGAVFRKWRETISLLLETSGLTKIQSQAFSTLLLAATQGALAISRGDSSVAPFDLVEKQMVAYAKTLLR